MKNQDKPLGPGYPFCEGHAVLPMVSARVSVHLKKAVVKLDFVFADFIKTPAPYKLLK